MTDTYLINGHDVIPLMTDYVRGQIVVSSSGEWLNFFTWRAFNHSVATGQDCWAVQSQTGWLKAHIIWPFKWDVTSYVLASYPDNEGVNIDSMPRNWTLLGSNDDVNWTTLDTQTEQYWGFNMAVEYPISSPGDYAYYKLNITANNWSYYTAVGEFGLRGSCAFFSPLAVVSASGATIGIVPPTLLQSILTNGIIAALRPITPGDFAVLPIPVTSFESIVKSGIVTYLQVVVPGMGYAEEIADRASGVLSIYKSTDGVINEIGSLPITGIGINEGARNQSITLFAQLAEA